MTKNEQTNKLTANEKRRLLMKRQQMGNQPSAMYLKNTANVKAQLIMNQADIKR